LSQTSSANYSRRHKFRLFRFEDQIMWHRLVASVVLATMPVSLAAQNSSRSKRIEDDVRAVLSAQQDAWNRGDIAGYMDGYARSEKTVFVSADSITRGWQTVLDRYRRRYDSREKMGTLTFSELEVTPLEHNTAMVVGRWQLKRLNDEPRGRFTLIFKKTRQGWRIIHDHTS
jgi:ketosteroid isomerase-like protein